MDYKVRLESLKRIQKDCPHATKRTEFLETCKKHKLPMHPNYITAYTKAGVLTVNKEYIFIKEVSLKGIERAYSYLNSKKDNLERLDAAIAYVKAHGYQVIKEEPNTEIWIHKKLS